MCTVLFYLNSITAYSRDPITGPDHPIYTELCVQYKKLEYAFKTLSPDFVLLHVRVLIFCIFFLSRHIPEHKQNAFSGKKVTLWHNSGAVLAIA